jgi:hypothetical protein
VFRSRQAILAQDGDDLRKLPLAMRANLERLLAHRPEGIFVNAFERGEIGPDSFPGRLSKYWTRQRTETAMKRAAESFR